MTVPCIMARAIALYCLVIVYGVFVFVFPIAFSMILREYFVHVFLLEYSLHLLIYMIFSI